MDTLFLVAASAAALPLLVRLIAAVGDLLEEFVERHAGLRSTFKKFS
jgi:hypothetical protein